MPASKRHPHASSLAVTGLLSNFQTLDIKENRGVAATEDKGEAPRSRDRKGKAPLDKKDKKDKRAVRFADALSPVTNRNK